MFSNRPAQVDAPEYSNLEDDSISSNTLHADLLSRARLLLTELTAFQSYLRSYKKEDAVGIRQFFSNIQSEAKSLERNAGVILVEQLIPGDKTRDEEIKRLHALRSSNLPFYEVIWQVAERCEGVVSLGMRNRRVPSANSKTEPVSSDQAPPGNKRGNVKPKDTNPADIVADDGETWIKVSTITEKRLLFEMAKEGWEGYDGGSSEDHTDSDDESGTRSGASHRGTHSLEILRLAEDMKMAASSVRVRYRHPKIHFILPRISEGRLNEIDAIVEDIRKTGATVECAAELKSRLNRHHPAFNSSDPSARFGRMLPRSRPPLTSALNIDCTILLALISDISHFSSQNLPSAPEGKYHSAIMRQIKSEETATLLESEIFPLLVTRQLHCTWHAARRMREIVQMMGTAAEKARAEIFFGEAACTLLSASELRIKLMELSDHNVPTELRLPIQVVDFDADAMLAGDSSSFSIGMMLQVASGLSEINRSVFLYGWCQKMVTISSNRAVAKEIEKGVCQLLDERDEVGESIPRDDVAGADIWVCDTARSLIGKEKGRREG
jgi:hypothetical protein